MKKFTLKQLPSDNLHLVHPQRFRIDYEKELNAAQYEAVTSVNGPHLIIAGAGTGKTRTVVYRVAYLVELGVKPDSILLLTFTNKAAREMMRRVADLLGGDQTSLWGGTFHSIGHRLLRRFSGEREKENIVGLDAELDEIRDAVHNRTRLACSGTCDDQMRTVH